jgi:murein L,D-transpeptidase YcbB/YkuD
MRTTLEAYRRIEQTYPYWPILSSAALGQFRSAGQVPAEVVERLHALGDFAAAGSPAAMPEHEAIERALKRFQSRHGLVADGVAGRATLEALSASPAQRVRQLALSLERLRWFPPLSGQRFVAVNVPAYRLWAVDLRPGRAAVALEMRVIVGAAGRTPTPVLAAPIKAVEFNPFWNVPRRIALEEILPRLAKAPGYLGENDMEAIDSVSEVPLPPGANVVSAVRAGRARIRQRPGANNVLGAMKILMPNPESIYLHATDATGLFGRARRDFSHGCIRVEKPAELAAFVLDDQQRWSLEQVAAAIAAGDTETVPLAAPVMAVLFYTTAVTERDGRVMFYKDIYGLDRLLANALAARASTK